MRPERSIKWASGLISSSQGDGCVDPAETVKTRGAPPDSQTAGLSFEGEDGEPCGRGMGSREQCLLWSNRRPDIMSASGLHLSCRCPTCALVSGSYKSVPSEEDSREHDSPTLMLWTMLGTC